MTAKRGRRSRQRASAPSKGAPARHLEEPLEDDRSSGKDPLWWEKKSRAFQADLSAKSLEKSAEKLGVSVESLERLGMGFDRYACTFPMRTGEGAVCGIRLRPEDGGKHAVKGSRPGLFIPEGVTPANVKIIAEGESDTAAALTLRVAGIGIPGASVAIGEAVAFIEQNPLACPSIIADNDPSGQDGARRLADELNAVGIPYRILTPPAPYGDLREWLKRGGLTREQLLGATDRADVHWPGGLPPGFVAVANWLARKGMVKVVGCGPFALLYVLMSYHGGNGMIYPTEDKLADLLGVSLGTVKRYKRILKDCGLIEWKRRGPGLACEYRVNLPPWKGQKKK